MRAPGARTRKAMVTAALPVGLLASGAMVWQSSHAAFSATTTNPGNAWAAGSVALADNDSGVALFNTTDDGTLKPGSTRSRCIRVDYTGDLASDIQLFVTTPPAGATSLDPYLVMSVEKGTTVTSSTAVAPDCSTGFTSAATPTFVYNSAQANTAGANTARTMSHLKATHSTYAAGILVSAATSQGTSLTFKVTYAVADDNAAQNTSSNASFVWEARNT